MYVLRKWLPLFIILILCVTISGCGLRGFVKNIQKDIDNFGAVTRTGKADY